MIEAIVFDFDGVIADSEPLHLRAHQEALAPLGMSLPREEYYARYLGYDDVGVFRELAATRQWEIDERGIQALIAEKTRVFDACLESGDHLYPAPPSASHAWPPPSRSASRPARSATRSRRCSAAAT